MQSVTFPKIKKGLDNKHYLVFPTNAEAEKWGWLNTIFCMRVACFGQFDNAYELYF